MLYDFNMCLQILVWEYRRFHGRDFIWFNW